MISDKDALEKLKELDSEIIKLKSKDDPRIAFGYDIKPLENDVWSVTLVVNPKSGFNINEVEKVVYVLHPTFKPNNIIAVDNPRNYFTLELQSWGAFHAMAIVVFKDKEKNPPVELTRWLPISLTDEPQRM